MTNEHPDAAPDDRDGPAAGHVSGEAAGGAGLDGAGSLEAESSGIRSVGAGSLGTGSLSTGSVGTGFVGTGSVGAGSVGAGSVGAGSADAVSVGTGSVGTESVGTESVGTESVSAESVGAESVGAGSAGSASVHPGIPRTLGGARRPRASGLRFPDAVPVEPGERRRRIIEIAIVLALSLGASAIYAIVYLADRLTQQVALNEQEASLNPSRSDREIFDLLYQLLPIVFDFAPVALVCWLLWQPVRPHFGRLGLDARRPGFDLLAGVGLVAVIGVPGIVLYVVGKAVGISVTVVPSPLDQYWWTVPILLLSALRAGVTEEFIVVGYLFERLRSFGWGPWSVILASAALRATYHAYQGFGAIIGNFAMGIVFGWLYAKTGRLWPLVIAHTLIDIAVFVGYPWAYTVFPQFFA